MDGPGRDRRSNGRGLYIRSRLRDADRSATSDSVGSASTNPPHAPLARLIPGPIASAWEETFFTFCTQSSRLQGSAAEEDADRGQEDRKSCDQQRYDDDCQDDKNHFSSFSNRVPEARPRPREPVRDPGFRRSCGGVVAGCGRLRCRDGPSDPVSGGEQADHRTNPCAEPHPQGPKVRLNRRGQ